jgi:hypothetical protein
MSDPFHDCQEVDEVLFLMLDLGGPEGLRQLLAHTAVDQETLNEAAVSLEAVGLAEGARIVRDAATQAVPCGISPKAEKARMEASRRYWMGQA